MSTYFKEGTKYTHLGYQNALHIPEVYTEIFTK
jgi:hypothetical protein